MRGYYNERSGRIKLLSFPNFSEREETDKRPKSLPLGIMLWKQ